MDGAWIVVAVEAVAILALFVLWRHAERQRRSLEERIRQAQLARKARRRRRAMLPRPETAVKAMWETASLVRDKGVSAAVRSSINEIAGWAEVERPALVELAGVDGCVAILFTDIEGSTALNDRLGDRAWNALLKQHDRVIVKELERQHGQVVKHQGDGYMVAFATAEQAVRSAIAMEQALAKSKGAPTLRVRIGIHYGSVVHRDNDIFGRNVAHAARVAAMAEGGEVLVSGAVVDEIAEFDDLDLRLIDLRTVELKGLSGDQTVGSIDWT